MTKKIAKNFGSFLFLSYLIFTLLSAKNASAFFIGTQNFKGTEGLDACDRRVNAVLQWPPIMKHVLLVQDYCMTKMQHKELST